MGKEKKDEDKRQIEINNLHSQIIESQKQTHQIARQTIYIYIYIYI